MATKGKFTLKFGGITGVDESGQEFPIQSAQDAAFSSYARFVRAESVLLDAIHQAGLRLRLESVCDAFDESKG